MDLLLLGAGAIVLIGITLWIVWPARTADAVGTAVRSEEVSETPMTDTVTTGLAPQGDRFEDQYTSATADLSAGGVAAAVEAMHADLEATPLAPRPAYGTTPLRPAIAAAPEGETSRTLSPRRTLGLGAGAALALGGGVAGAWVYARWQRERNKPINRLRRGAREMAGRLGERIPDVDELPHGAAPMSGAATALLLTALIASRALRRDPDDPTQDVREHAAELIRESAEAGVDRGRKQPAILGIGLGGIALVAGAAFAIWRLLHRGQPDRSTWYAGE
jgi:hypothetical protein